ncbi:tRNA adenosine(34) deaminase TadA [soil metagenome]
MSGDAPTGFSEADLSHMRRALALARGAADKGDVPIGSVVARGEEVLGEGGNEREQREDPTAHAEVIAIRAASTELGGWRLPDTTIYVTLEPCVMCAGAISLARIPRLVFAASDPKGGAAGGVLDLYEPPSSSVLNHHPVVESGLLAAEAGELLTGFFASRR